MREILFRGKSVDTGEWVEGDFCRPCSICFEETGEDSDTKVWNDYAVAAESIGQYTGLKDRHGKKIFEGDICLFDYDGEEEPSEYLVKWFKEMACFNVIYELNGSSDNLDEFFAQHSEVVANVYDRMDKKRRTEG